MGGTWDEGAVRALLGAAPFGLRCDEGHMASYRAAFTHDSHSNELMPGGRKRGDVPYERLEFVGDAVIDLVVSDHLYRSPMDYDEGGMTEERKKYAGDEEMAERLERKGIDLFPLCVHSRGLEVSEKNRRVIAASVFEAIVGAAYFNEGYAKAREIVEGALIR
ncbi:MAG: ribonuclease III domain-containing protein [Methanomassiliicoccaceae archaeon]|nr:ribonuclease III domain-containing protein [Methanomassiliicoccaceae archaeon]